MNSHKKLTLITLATLALATTAACAVPPRPATNNPTAKFIGTPIRYTLDGVTDDLLTAGLGADGLRGPAPAFADAGKPTPLELRRRAIYMNYRGLMDLTLTGGFGATFGPTNNLRIAGVEYLTAVSTPDGASLTTVLLQIPKHFDPNKPCLIAVASSGSRGIYGALPTAGEWGLRHGCAVTHTDKGTGTGVFDRSRNLGIRIDGTAAPGGDPLLSFIPAPATTDDKQIHAVLFKHAQSGANVEAHWGEYVLQSIDAAFQLLNREYPQLSKPLKPANTRIIAAGISNGGGAVLRAVERDVANWIDGAVVSEPNLNLTGLMQVFIIESGGQTYDTLGLSLYDYSTQHMLLQPCAALAETDATAPFFAATQVARPALEKWCADLRTTGVISGDGIATQAAQAREKLLTGAGILPQALLLSHVNVQTTLWPAIVVTYGAAYTSTTSTSLPCGASFAATDSTGAPRDLTTTEFSLLFADSNGIPPTSGINIVLPNAAGQRRAANAGTVSFASCLRALQTGTSSSEYLNTLTKRLAEGQNDLRMSARLRKTPVILLHGRGDALIPVNHTSRAYYALNKHSQRKISQLHYYEIEHAQHFDAFMAFPGFSGRYVALHPYFLEAMTLMSSHLTEKSPLPPSQVVRTDPSVVNAATKIPRAPGDTAIRLNGKHLIVP